MDLEYKMASDPAGVNLESSDILVILKEADLEEHLHSFKSKGIKKVKHLKDTDTTSLQEEIGIGAQRLILLALSLIKHI